VKVKVDGNQITPTFVAPGQQGEYAPLIYFDVTLIRMKRKKFRLAMREGSWGIFPICLEYRLLLEGPIGTLDMTFKFPL